MFGAIRYFIMILVYAAQSDTVVYKNSSSLEEVGSQCKAIRAQLVFLLWEGVEHELKEVLLLH